MLTVASSGIVPATTNAGTYEKRSTSAPPNETCTVSAVAAAGHAS